MNILLLQAGHWPVARLHEKAGFRIVGVTEKIGKLNGRWRDALLLERRSRVVGIEGEER
jgi:L-amino acid N-acyltransferase YncA